MRRALLIVATLMLSSGTSCKKSSPPPAAPAPADSAVTSTPSPTADPAPASTSTDDDDDRTTAAPASDPGAPAAPAGTPPAATLALGATGFEQGMCAKCHGANGEGSDRAPNLTDREWLHCNGTVAGIRAVLMKGVSKDELKDPSRPHAMNPATNLIEDDQVINALAVYIWSLGQK